MISVDALATEVISAIGGLPDGQQFPGRRPGQYRFDGPGGTLVHAAVRDAMAAYMGGPQVSNDHGVFAASRWSDELVAWAAAELRRLLDAPAGVIVFGANMTSLTTTFIRSLGLRTGDEVVCTQLDHDANRMPWYALQRDGIVVREAAVDADGALKAEAVLDLTGPRTRWVAVTAASNALGTTPDLHTIVAGAHRAGARVFVDGVQAVAHQRIGLRDMACDAFVTAAYKWYGPHCGALWISDECVSDLHLPEQVPSADAVAPGHLQLGTSNFEAIFGTGIAAGVLSRWDREAVWRRERELFLQLHDALAGTAGLRLLGPGPEQPRSPVLSFQIDEVPEEKVAEILDQKGISVWHGNFYASAALRAVSPQRPQAVRAGIAAYTTADDVTALAAAVREITRGPL